MECAICIQQVEHATTLGCGHGFHAECIQQSGKHSPLVCPLCPLCRAPIEACEKGLEAVSRYNRSGVMMGEVSVLIKGAEMGSMQCGLLLGNMYHAGMGVPQDEAEAERWWHNFDNNASACNNIAAIAHRKGDAVKAETFYRKAIQISPYAIYYINLAQLLEGSEEAIQNYYYAIDLYAGSVHLQAAVYLLMGKSLYKKKRPDEALPHFRQSVALAPTNVSALLMLALCCDDADEAHAHTASVLALESGNVDALCMKGRVYALQHDRTGADDMMTRLSLLAPHAKYTKELAASIRKEFGPPTRKRARV